MSHRLFHLILHRAPAELPAAVPAEYAGQAVEQIPLDNATLGDPLPLSFDQAEQRLQQLPRLYFEPDGSFVWNGGGETESWQVEGLLVDRGEALQAIELWGSCPPAALQRLLDVCSGGEPMPLLFQIVQPDMFLTRDQLMRWMDSL